MKKVYRKIKEFIQKNTLRFFLIFVLLSFLLYIFYEPLRCYLLEKSIDPSFITGFLMLIGLILNWIQNSYDKKFNYNMRLIESIENKGLSVIGKLLTIKQKSEIYFITLKQLKIVIGSRQTYKDLNDTLSKKDINDGMELIIAYIETYFKEECHEWNELLDKLNTLATYSSNIFVNYNENMNLILTGQIFKNESLDQIDYYVTEAEKINKEINELTLKMRDKIVFKINESTGKLKNSIYFKI
jgi:hypothetical protein